MKIWFLVALLLAGVASAEFGLVHKCFDANGNGKTADACAVRGWVRPAPGDAILSSADATMASWQTGVFRTWSTMPASAVVMRCNSDVPVGQFGAVDPCGSGVKPFFPKAAIELPLTPQPPPIASEGTTLTWTVPTQNTDGSPLTNLAGYRIYHGRTEAATQPLTELLATINNPATTTYEATGLSMGPHLFEALAFTATVQSARSNRVMHIVQPGPVPPTNDECVSDPLRVTNISWRSMRTGRRANTFDTGNKAVRGYTFEWPLTGPRVLTVTDTRGCVVTVTR